MRGRKALISFSNQWATYALQLLASLIIARKAGPEIVGEVGFLISLLGLLTMVGELGFNQAHPKRVAEGLPINDCLSTYFWIVMIKNVLLIVGTGLLLMFPAVFGSSTAQTAFILFAIYQFLSNLGTIPLLTFNGTQEVVKSGMVLVIGRCMRILMVVTLLIVWRWLPMLTAIAVAFVVDSIAQNIIGFYFLNREGFKLKRPSGPMLESYWRYVKPIALLAPLPILMESADRILLKFLGSTKEIGYYNVARNILEVSKSIPTAISAIVFPSLALAFAKKEHAAVEHHVYEANRKGLLITTPICLIGAALSSPILYYLFGKPFLPAAGALASFWLLTLLITYSSPYGYMLYVIEKHHVFLWVNPLTVATYFSALFAVNHFNHGLTSTSAAWCYWAVELVPLGPRLYYSYRFAKVKPRVDILAKLVLAACPMGLALYYAHDLSPWVWILSVLGGLGLYVLILKMTHLISPQDTAYFRDLLNLRKLQTYVWGEISGPQDRLP